MQSGRKPLAQSVKEARGTAQPCRARDEVTVPATAPKMPSYLTPEAKKVWKEELGRVMAAGVVDSDSSLFASYCCLEAACRDQFKVGEVPKTAALTELRRMRELLGIGGPSSRVSRGSGSKPEQTNPFFQLGPKSN